MYNGVIKNALIHIYIYIYIYIYIHTHTHTHITNLIEKATVETKVEKKVLAFGLNNRTHRLRISAMRECVRLIQVTQEKLPDAQM